MQIIVELFTEVLYFHVYIMYIDVCLWTYKYLGSMKLLREPPKIKILKPQHLRIGNHTILFIPVL